MEENKKSQIGTVMTNDFTFWYKSRKKKSRNCLIPDPQIDCENNITITLHEQLAIVSAIKFYNEIKNVIDSSKRKNPSYKKNYKEYAYNYESLLMVQGQKLPISSFNYVVGNIGCIISTNNYQKSGKDHIRKFITYPISLAEQDKTITINKKRDSEDKRKNHHSEESLLDILSKNDRLLELITRLLKANEVEIENIKNGTEKRKIYAIIFDLHSTQDTCKFCQKDFYKFTIEKINLIRKQLKEKLNFEIAKEENFKILFRISSAIASTNPCWVFEDNVKINNSILIKIDESTNHTFDRDLKIAKMPLIIHGNRASCDDENSEVFRLLRWYDKRAYQENKIPFLEKPTYSCFENSKDTVEVIAVPDVIDIPGSSNTNVIRK